MNSIPHDSQPDFAHVENGAIAGRYLSQFWQPIALSSDYASGVAKRVQAIGTWYTLYRGDDGKMRMTQDRCPHRGTSLAYGWVEGNDIRCRYHGWKFDSEGRGKEFPAETATYAQRICLKTFPVQEYLGLLFAYMGEGEPPEMMRFPELEDEARGELMVRTARLPYNYFQRVENDQDEVHPHYVHRQMAEYGFVEIPRITARETEYGIIGIATRKNTGQTMEGHTFMPNILLREVPIGHDKEKMTIHLAWRVPINDTSTLSFMINRVAKVDQKIVAREKTMENPAVLAAKVMNCEMQLEDVDPTYPMLAVVQDTVAIGGQGVIADRSAENLGQSDRAIALLRRIWAREMAALERGEPLKQWRRPADFRFRSMSERHLEPAETEPEAAGV
jgi:5,5'-dehydrodivanillate O-demethylase